MHGVLYSALTSSALARSLTVPRTLMRGMPCACAKNALSHDMRLSLGACVDVENRALLRHAVVAPDRHGVDILEVLREDGPVPTTYRKLSG